MRKNLWIIAVVFVAAFVLRLIWTNESVKGVPQAEAGVLDLSGWNRDEHEIVPLRGKWAFYPGVLLEPGQPLPGDDGARYVSVPGKFDNAVGEDRPTAFGFGTYRLEIKLPDGEPRDYSLRVQRIRTAYKLFADGKLIAQRGEPGVDAKSTTPIVVPLTARLTTGGDSVELLIQASNFHYARLGGIFEDIRLGDPAAIERQTQLVIAGNNLLMGFYLVNGIYFLALFLFRKRNKELLYFGILFWMMLLFWSVQGERLLFILLPWVTYNWQTKLQMLSSLGTFLSMLLFVKEMFPNIARPRAVKLACWVVAGGALVVVSTDVRFFSRLESLGIAFDTVVFFYALYILVRAAGRSSEPGHANIFVAAMCVFSEALMQAIVYLGIMHVAEPFPLERLVFVLSMATLLARRFFSNMEQVEVLSKQLIVKDRLKDDFLANTSQEIRTPLQGMINLAQLMIEEDSLKDQRQAERLQLMVTTGRRLAQQLNDMLDLTKLNDGDIELRLHPVDLSMAINGALEVMRYMAGGREIRFENQTKAGLPYAMADDQRVLQILFNLLHHAVKSGAEGTVTVTAERAPEHNAATVTVGAVKSGSGFDEEVGSEDSAVSDVGLDISRKLAEMHGGRFAVLRPTSNELAFVFTLPLAEAADRTASTTFGEEVAAGLQRQPAPPPRTEKRGAAAKTGAPRVLVVEDDPVTLQIMQDILSQEGLDVVVAADGLEGLKAWEREAEWDLVVLNVMLPRLSGYDLCRAIRERHSFYDLPVLFLTSRHQPADLLVGYNAGANDYVIQPLNDSEFRARARTLLRMKQSIRDRLHMEMALIQAQIKPHFLYNTLNTIASLSEIDPERTRELLNDFGSYLRSSFDLRNLDRFVPFSKEWALVHSYLQIEQARFGTRMSLSMKLPDNPSFHLPPLTIQPIVENALRHGILTRFEGGHLQIEVSEEADGYTIAVRDNGVGFPPEKIEPVLSGTYRGGIGLVNVHQRLMNAYGAGLAITSVAGEGTEVRLRIPLKKEEQR
ncbi:ATP-binding protein [Cohnella sp. GCM10027633]|uniref:ATP-binding protein n=1 Tax=unclassified Cohnella TaxID=2636738 RepID=UPI003644CFDE